MPIKLSPGVLEIQGTEAQKFLQAIVSSDVDALSVGNSQASLLLTPAGKVVSAFWIARTTNEQFLLIMERAKCEATLESLKRFLIRTKATIENVSDSYSAVLLHENAEFPEGSVVIERTHLSIPDAVLVLVAFSDQYLPTSNCGPSYEDLRISWGAVSARDVDDTIPQEAHLEKNAVSFSKGCYLGQELVCRIDSREATTPFSYYAVADSSNDIGTVTSARQSINASVDGFAYGPFSAIVRVPRKEADNAESSGAQPVSGYFAC